jgi:hypothetical protein
MRHLTRASMTNRLKRRKLKLRKHHTYAIYKFINEIMVHREINIAKSIAT